MFTRLVNTVTFLLIAFCLAASISTGKQLGAFLVISVLIFFAGRALLFIAHGKQK